MMVAWWIYTGHAPRVWSGIDINLYLNGDDIHRTEDYNRFLQLNISLS